VCVFTEDNTSIVNPSEKQIMMTLI